MGVGNCATIGAFDPKGGGQSGDCARAAASDVQSTVEAQTMSAVVGPFRETFAVISVVSGDPAESPERLLWDK